MPVVTSTLIIACCQFCVHHSLLSGLHHMWPTAGCSLLVAGQDSSLADILCWHCRSSRTCQCCSPSFGQLSSPHLSACPARALPGCDAPPTSLPLPHALHLPHALRLPHALPQRLSPGDSLHMCPKFLVQRPQGGQMPSLPSKMRSCSCRRHWRRQAARPREGHRARASRAVAAHQSTTPARASPCVGCSAPCKPTLHRWGRQPSHAFQQHILIYI